MHLIADLHIHSRFSRATSRDLDFVALHRAALTKGIGLVGTGDFTHPGWLAEIREQLEPAEDGLFRLKPAPRRAAEANLPKACAGEVRFVLQVEVSNIYKRDGRTRKNHNLVFVPSLDAAERFNAKLAAIGNLASDGRPILGLDARHLLEIALETSPLAFLVPAHIWTPWFSLLGSKSGFDSLEECFGDLAGHVFAAETGLSSDPPMNWRVSGLDRLTLVSSSDAHSPAKLGREANLLDIELGYEPLLAALRERRGYRGTIEFFPEEGKYHLDGHRKCGQRLEPERTRELRGVCPVCGGPITVGVMSRVAELADRPPGARPEGAAAFTSLVPLGEIAGEVVGAGPSSGRAVGVVERVLAELGPELAVLREAPLEDIGRVGGPVLAEAVRRVRAGEVAIDAGYDGEFGTVRIFAEGERARFAGQLSMAGAGRAVRDASRGRRLLASTAPSRAPEPRPEPVEGEAEGRLERARPGANGGRDLRVPPSAPADPLAGLDASQRRAVEAGPAPLLIVAGPGTGKTRTLVARIVRQVRDGIVRPGEVLALAFTNQAAAELRERLDAALHASAEAGAPFVATFHALCLRLLDDYGGGAPRIEQEEDLDALLDGGLALLERDDVRAAVSARFRSVSIDEYQDVSDVQAAIVERLAPGGSRLTAIGDPDQAIYGFRGARPGHFARFKERFPGAERVALGVSYRLTGAVHAVARAVLPGAPELEVRREGIRVEVVACPSPASEAEQIAARIERLVGGTSHFAVDTGRGAVAEWDDVGFGDVAVLTRTKAQRREILDALGRSGVPCAAIGEDEPHDPRGQKVAAMTMHAAKGREFEIVFVAGVERGIVPLALPGFVVDPEEERRLLYVALTRAKRHAILSFSRRRTLFGVRLEGGPSPFLGRVPDGACVRSLAQIPDRPGRSQLELF
jgi:DNA helicase II / ATP-dependent DNA helicase PcrA